MNFTFGKYEGSEIDDVLDMDRKYCEWIAPKITNKYPEIAQELSKKLGKITPNPEDPKYMNFGKYEGRKVVNVVSDDKFYANWLINKDSFKEEYPKTYEIVKKYYDLIYNLQATNIRHFYVLKFVDRPYVKIGITKNYIHRRLYNYSHSMNKYDKDVIDYSNSFVFRTTDLDIEKKVLEFFDEKRTKKAAESLLVSVNEVNNYIDLLKRLNPNLFYLKKCVKDFIPFNYSTDFKKTFKIKINQFQDFVEVYEENLRKVGLFDKYNPDFQDIREYLN